LNACFTDDIVVDTAVSKVIFSTQLIALPVGKVRYDSVSAFGML
jgi:hypothetical protein